MKALIENKNVIIAQNCEFAKTFSSRFFGLMGRRKFPIGNGIYFTNCNSIHMFFMFFSIDVLFISKDGIIISMLEDFSPWKLKFPVKDAVDTLELPTGTIKMHSIEIGDKVILVER